MDHAFMTTGAAMVIAWIALIVSGAMKLAHLHDNFVRQEAKLNLILKQMGIRFPPPPSAAVQAIARTQRIAAIKVYREETGLGLKQALDIIDRWRAKQ